MAEQLRLQFQRRGSLERVRVGRITIEVDRAKLRLRVFRHGGENPGLWFEKTYVHESDLDERVATEHLREIERIIEFALTDDRFDALNLSGEVFQGTPARALLGRAVLWNGRTGKVVIRPDPADTEGADERVAIRIRVPCHRCRRGTQTLTIADGPSRGNWAYVVDPVSGELVADLRTQSVLCARCSEDPFSPASSS